LVILVLVGRKSMNTMKIITETSEPAILEVFPKRLGEHTLLNPTWAKMTLGSSTALQNGLTGMWYCYGMDKSGQNPIMTEDQQSAANTCASIDNYNSTGKWKKFVNITIERRNKKR